MWEKNCRDSGTNIKSNVFNHFPVPSILGQAGQEKVWDKAGLLLSDVFAIGYMRRGFLGERDKYYARNAALELPYRRYSVAFLQHKALEAGTQNKLLDG